MIQKATFPVNSHYLRDLGPNCIQSGPRLHTIYIRIRKQMVLESVENRLNTKFWYLDGS